MQCFSKKVFKLIKHGNTVREEETKRIFVPYISPLIEISSDVKWTESSSLKDPAFAFFLLIRNEIIKLQSLEYKMPYHWKLGGVLQSQF